MPLKMVKAPDSALPRIEDVGNVGSDDTRLAARVRSPVVFFRHRGKIDMLFGHLGGV